MTAPTTRETADHAELARLAEAAIASGVDGQLPSTSVEVSAFASAANPARVLALLSEIAMLRGALGDAQNADAENDAHLRTRATQAERQRDELRKALEFYANPEIYKPHPHGLAFDDRDVSFRAKSVLANQGAE